MIALLLLLAKLICRVGGNKGGWHSNGTSCASSILRFVGTSSWSATRLQRYGETTATRIQQSLLAVRADTILPLAVSVSDVEPLQFSSSFFNGGLDLFSGQFVAKSTNNNSSSSNNNNNDTTGSHNYQQMAGRKHLNKHGVRRALGIFVVFLSYRRPAFHLFNYYRTKNES